MPSRSDFNVSRFVEMFRDGTEPFIRNVETRVELWEASGRAFPVTVNNEEWDNSYVCSPYTHYVSYALEECLRLKGPARSLATLVRGMGLWFRSAGINRCVHINNFLLSTNLYPDWDGEDFSTLHRRALSGHPEHAIVFRSLNHSFQAPLLRKLQSAGYRLIPSRLVWLLKEEGYLEKRDCRNDARLFEDSELQYVAHDEFARRDFARAEELYNFLYLDRYSRYNPQFTAAYMEYCHKFRLFIFHGLRGPDGVLCGVAGGFRRGRVITNPVFGYDTAQPKEAGLYRMLTHIVMRDAAENGWIMNLSAGVGRFKRTRGGVPDTEYSAVYTRHLPLWRRLPWMFLERVCAGVAMPLIRAHEL